MVIDRKIETEQSKIKYKYAQLKRFHHDLQPQVYMYAFMYIDCVTMPVEEIFPLILFLVENLQKNISSSTSPKTNWVYLNKLRRL